MHNYGRNLIKRVKTNKKYALKFASYVLDRWYDLSEYTPTEDTRKNHKLLNNQYISYTKIQVILKNNLISLIVLKTEKWDDKG